MRMVDDPYFWLRYQGQELILSHHSASSQGKTLIVPDGDVDGLSAGVIIYKTLTALGLPPSLIEVHLLPKKGCLRGAQAREAIGRKKPRFIILVDHGSGSKQVPIVDSAGTKSLIIDHHMSNEFPKNALVISIIAIRCIR